MSWVVIPGSYVGIQPTSDGALVPLSPTQDPGLCLLRHCTVLLWLDSIFQAPSELTMTWVRMPR
jgi:hypothetical protein